MSKDDINYYKNHIVNRLESIDDKRDTIDIINWLKITDFFEAPASTKFHGAFSGGLAQHSWNVYSWLLRLDDCYCTNIPYDSMIITALLHDVCKIGLYKTDYRNVKSYDAVDVENNKNARQDEKGFYVWKQEKIYKADEDFKFGGHGSKSVYLISQFMSLKPEEAAAINCHMGAYGESKIQQENVSPVYETNPLAFLLHVADETSTFIDHI